VTDLERRNIELQLAAAEKILAIRLRQQRRLQAAGQMAIAGEELDQAEINVIQAQLDVDQLKLCLEPGS